jgi:hypothetical protein
VKRISNSKTGDGEPKVKIPTLKNRGWGTHGRLRLIWSIGDEAQSKEDEKKSSPSKTEDVKTKSKTPTLKNRGWGTPRSVEIDLVNR